MTKKGKSCGNCIYYDNVGLTCKKEPPIRDAYGNAAWPRVAPHQWCGVCETLPDFMKGELLDK